MKHRLSATAKTNLSTYSLVIALYAVFQLLLVTGNLTNSLSGQLVPICVYISMAISLNLVVGISGELSLGHAGFMSVGAFTGVIAAASLTGSIPNGVTRLIVAMIIGALSAGAAGVAVGVPVLRLRGDYLAIVTLAFGEIIKNLVNNLYIGVDGAGVHLSMKSAADLALLEGGRLVVNGPMGATGIAKLSTFFIGFLLILFTLYVVLNVIGSRHGRAIMAARDNRIAADSVGISVTRYKLTAFVISAALAGMAGALYAMNYSTITAKKFDFNTSILVLVFVVLGGMGNIRGSILAAAILTILPELLRAVADYRMLVYAIVLILVMMARNNETIQRYFDKLGGRLRDLLRRGRRGGDAV